MAISLAQLKVWQERARQDDACNYFVPSDIRQLIGEIFDLRLQRAELVDALSGVVKIADRKTVEFDVARTAIAKFKS